MSTKTQDHKSVAQELQEKAKSRLQEVREAIAPHIQEEADLVAMVPGETRHFHTADEVQVEPEKPEPTPPSPSQPQAAPRRRRSRKGGTRAEQAVTLIAQNPGISASDVASALSIKPNYLYRVLGDLEKEGRVRKDGRQYFPVGS